MIKALVDDKGRIRTFADYQRQVITLGEDYYKSWLEAEYNTVIAAAQMAAQWDDFQRDKDIFPYLVYKTQHDKRVRRAHQLLHDVCKHIDDTFWDTYYPPNGWRCRCYILQSKSTKGYITEPEAYPDDKSLPLAFRTNPAKSGKIWTKDHPYFQTTTPEVKKKVYDTRARLINDPSFFIDIDGISVHYSNYFSESFDKEIKMAKILKATINKDITILSQIDVKGNRIPDFFIGQDIIAEYKEFTSTNYDTIYNTISKEAINQLLHSRVTDRHQVVIISIPDSIDSDYILDKFFASKRVIAHSMELWIYQNDILKKHKAR